MSAVIGVELPRSWSASRLKYATSLLNRGSAPNYADEGQVRVISQAANQSSGLDWTRTRFHACVGDHRGLKGLLSAQDVLINSTGTGTLGRIGHFASPIDGIPCMADSHVTVARFDPGVMHPRFAFYWLASAPFQKYVLAVLAVGATNQIELNREQLGDAPIPVPPPDEQRRIADFLDVEIARIDELVSLRNAQKAVVGEFAMGVVSGAFPLQGEAPLVRLGYIARIQSGITVDGARSLTEDVVTRPYLRVANVQVGHVSLESVTEITVPRVMAAGSSLRAGDVLMTEGGDLDKLGRGTVWRGEIENCLHQNHVFAVRPDLRHLDSDYLALLTRTAYARSYFESTGTKTTNLASTSSGKIRDFRVPLASKSQQLDIVHMVTKKLDQTEQAAVVLEQQLTLLAERRQALITAAVTGQFDVTTARTTTSHIPTQAAIRWGADYAGAH